MPVKRIQKLLFSEYSDFEDMVLIESPFAQTTREGKGVRQVHLGLTPTKFILATDILPPVEHTTTGYLSGIDPEIETFELIAIYPIECVNLSVFKRRQRQVLKARFSNNRLMYLELGGSRNRQNYWNLWCEKVRFLSPEYSGSSHSETSVAATSSSSSNLYLIDKREVRKNGRTQIWCQFGTLKDSVSTGNDKILQWTDRFLYMGKNFEESPSNYRPIMLPPSRSQFLDNNKNKITVEINQLNSGNTNEIRIESEEAIKIWEISSHKRRYAFMPQPLFLYGLGVWGTTPGARYSIQMKKLPSAVSVRRPPVEHELHLSITKQQLLTTTSCNFDRILDEFDIDNKQFNCVKKRQVVFFWTPDYWYRPMSAKYAYLQLQKHLNQIRNNHNRIESAKIPAKHKQTKSKQNKFKLFNKLKKTKQSNADNPVITSENPVEFLQRCLYIDAKLTVWDFDSTTLSQQLTLIDRDLFLNVTITEFKTILGGKGRRNAPNFATFVGFAHRISCLVATDILRNDCERLRARLITRFINVAYKCYQLRNFHSSRIVIYGLQSPAIYRLKSTWNYVRRKHSSRYLIFKFLCKFFGKSQFMFYQKLLHFEAINQPFMPFIGDIVEELINEKFLYYNNENLTETVNANEIFEKTQESVSGYLFNVDNKAVDYLLKARYEEEKENFYHSIKLEPS